MGLRLTLNGRTSARLRCERTGATATIRAEDVPDESGEARTVLVGGVAVEFGPTEFDTAGGKAKYDGWATRRVWIEAPAWVRIERVKKPAPPPPPARTLADYRRCRAGA